MDPALSASGVEGSSHEVAHTVAEGHEWSSILGVTFHIIEQQPWSDHYLTNAEASVFVLEVAL